MAADTSESSTTPGFERHGLAGISEKNAAEHQPEAGPDGAFIGQSPGADAEDARKGVVRDAHQKERHEPEELGMAVDLAVIDRDFTARGDSRRLIMPVVAPSVSVRKSEPMMKCGEKGLAAAAGAGRGLAATSLTAAARTSRRKSSRGRRWTVANQARGSWGHPRRRSLRGRSARAPGVWPESGGSSLGSTWSAARCCTPRRLGGPTEIRQDLGERHALRAAGVRERMFASATGVETAGGEGEARGGGARGGPDRKRGIDSGTCRSCDPSWPGQDPAPMTPIIRKAKGSRAASRPAPSAPLRGPCRSRAGSPAPGSARSRPA